MPEYAQVQTYATCNQRTYSIVASHYRSVLEQLGCTDARVLQWLDSVHWPTSEDDGFGDIYVSSFMLAPEGKSGTNNPPATLQCAGVAVSLYTDSAVPSTEDLPSWVGFDLLFETETLRESATSQYKPEVGALLWRIVQKLAAAFRELGAYLTDEWQEGQPWRALTANMGDPWAFELAIFPRSQAIHFSEVPAGFQGTVTEQGFGFAQANRWEQLPWLDIQ